MYVKAFIVLRNVRTQFWGIFNATRTSMAPLALPSTVSLILDIESEETSQISMF